MKTILNLALLSLFFLEILSPFLIGYLNAKTKPAYVIKTEEAKPEAAKEASQPVAEVADLNLFDESFCDSKSLKFKDEISVNE